MVKKLALLVALAGLARAGLASCAEDVPRRTELVLVADTDIARVETIEFSIKGPDGRIKTAQGAAGSRAPGSRSLGFVYDGKTLGPFTLTATGLDQDDALLSRTAQVSFVEGKTLIVPLHLVESCIDVVCQKKAEQCTEYGCKPSELRSSELQSWDREAPGLPRWPGDGGMGQSEAGTAPDAGRPVRDAGTDGSAPMKPEGGLPEGGVGICDGETVDLSRDDRHCGECGNVCFAPAAQLHAENHCVQGTCVVSCLPNFADCDGNPASGCEADMRADKHCKACDNECKGGRRCVDGVCVK